MRRVVSTILFVLGGWILSSEVMMAWLNLGMGVIGQAVGMASFLAFAAAPTLLGTWVSPGNRPAELGLTLMVSAGVGAVISLTMFLTLNDPAVAKMLPPDQQLPDLAIDPLSGAINLLLIGGGGFALWRRGRARAKANEAELERVFGD